MLDCEYCDCVHIFEGPESCVIALRDRVKSLEYQIGEAIDTYVVSLENLEARLVQLIKNATQDLLIRLKDK